MSNPRVLVVDDEKSIRQLLRSCLSEEGYEIETAPDGVVGMERILKRDYNLVITDVMMPRLGGLDLLKNIKVSRPELPVVIITGYATTDITIQALKLGAVDFITKPFKLSEMFFVVKRIVDLQKREMETREVFNLITESSRTFECASKDLDEDAVLRVIIADLTDMNQCTAAESMKISLAIREAIDNAIEHGNLELPSGHKHKEYVINPQAFQRWKTQRLEDPKFGERKIRIQLNCVSDRMEVSVVDEGTGFDTSRLSAILEGAEDEQGELHGYKLMCLSMDEVRYNDEGNRVTLVKLRDGDGS